MATNMDLLLDPVMVNSKLAEKYMKTYNSFSAWPEPGKFWHVNKYPNDKVDYDTSELNQFKIKQTTVQPITPVMQRKLVEKLRENESLFCQLEYLERNIDEIDVRSHLFLICQHLQCSNDSWNYDNNLYLVMSESTPLFVLGNVAALMAKKSNVIIISSQKTAPICYLFTDLCGQVGWNVPLIFMSDPEKIDDKYFFKYAPEYACTGVVTESADIDSALDVFIASSVKAPWKLEGILVQESVYEEVLSDLAARCGRASGGAGGELAAGGKVFAADALGAGVPVAAYRTARELCALLQQRTACSRSLSLWAADSQLAHELALAAPASTVWINDYATFHGPPASVLPFYDRSVKYMASESAVEALRKRWTAWKAMSKIERGESILKQFEALSKEKDERGVPVEDLQSYVMTVRDHSFVSVDCGKICFGVEQPADLDCIVDFDNDDMESIKSSLAAVVNGAPVCNFRTESCSPILKALQEAGAPVLLDYKTAPLNWFNQRFIRKNLKVIRSNYGTIFAN